ncbi:carbohydrate-binding module family 18 protein, partial [Polychaeton citri CBS 116435]
AKPETDAKGSVSPDGTCGGSTGYTCKGSAWGDCCGKNGWCGSTEDYCGVGCNKAFGVC